MAMPGQVPQQTFSICRILQSYQRQTKRHGTECDGVSSLLCNISPLQLFAFPKVRNRYLDSPKPAQFPHVKVYKAHIAAAIDLSTVSTDTGGASGGASGEPGGLGARVSLSLALATFSQAMKRRKEVRGALGLWGFGAHVGEAPGFDGFWVWGLSDQFTDGRLDDRWMIDD